MEDNPITYDIDDRGPVVRYLSPSRKFSNLRDELNNDARLINQKYGKVYLAFSSGVDSQVILRCFLDTNSDFEAFFIHSKGYNDKELKKVYESEQFYGIKIKILELELAKYQDLWIQKRIEDNLPTCVHYPFEWASEILPEPWPIVMSGANEPCVVGNKVQGVYIAHNINESLLLRFQLLGKKRKVLDFPFSAESLSAYYCDEILKTYEYVCPYYNRNGLYYNPVGTSYHPIRAQDRFNYYFKGLIKGQFFQSDILWPPKLSGYENFPAWTIPSWNYPTKLYVSVPYKKLVSHLESYSGITQEFRGWFLSKDSNHFKVN